jgi:hypothetical protein
MTSLRKRGSQRYDMRAAIAAAYPSGHSPQFVYWHESWLLGSPP